jgi:hypothetical protein
MAFKEEWPLLIIKMVFGVYGLLRGVASLEGDDLVVFYYLGG